MLAPIPLTGEESGSEAIYKQQIRDEGTTVYDREAAITFRAIEQGARVIGAAAGADDGYLSLMGRLLQVNRAAAQSPGPSAPASSIILP